MDKLNARDQAARDGTDPTAPSSGGPGATMRNSDIRSISCPPTGAMSATGGSERSAMSRTGDQIAQQPIYESQVSQMSKGRVTDVITNRVRQWKPHKSELYTSMPRTRFGMTIYPDTRHVTEASVPLSGSYMGDGERFKTTNNVHSLFAVPDPLHPQTQDTMKKHSRGEFRVERIRQRQTEFADRCWAANEAAREFDEMKVARKAMNLLDYERKCHMSCC